MPPSIRVLKEHVTGVVGRTIRGMTLA